MFVNFYTFAVYSWDIIRYDRQKRWCFDLFGCLEMRVLILWLVCKWPIRLVVFFRYGNNASLRTFLFLAWCSRFLYMWVVFVLHVVINIRLLERLFHDTLVPLMVFCLTNVIGAVRKSFEKSSFSCCLLNIKEKFQQLSPTTSKGQPMSTES